MPSPTDSPNLPPKAADLDVRGAVPAGLSGRLVGIGRDGVLHVVQVDEGRVSYRVRRFRTDAVVHNLVAFSGSILAFGADSPAYELSTEFDTLRRVDLAGNGRAVAAYPKHDPATGELHLIAHDTDGAQAHVVVSAGALTRHCSPVLDTPNRVTDLALTDDRVVFVADGHVGIESRDREPRTTWIATGAAAAHPVHAYDAGDTVVLLALTPSLERWTLHPGARNIQREVLDPTPQRFAHGGNQGVDRALRCLWTIGESTISQHDLVSSGHVHHDLRPDVPGDLVFVPDSTRQDHADGGWLIGFIHETSGATTELRVIDAADVTRPAIATVPIPRFVPRGLSCTWIPSIQQ
ncbi:MAG: carotenoid oxygenase family protein [Ilumatobacteraceae bacterium]